MMTTRQRLVALANLLGIRTSRFIPQDTDDPFQNQVDVFIETPSGRRFRVGYWDGNMFFRENPVMRTLWRYGINVHEGRVGDKSEPQYDLVFDFDDNGEVVYMDDQRIAMEADF